MALREEAAQLCERLGGGWRFDSGTAEAYGLERMDFVEVSHVAEGINVRVWWWENEVRISARLGVPYEASAEVFMDSAEDICAVMRALCTGRYSRRAGTVDVKVGRRIHVRLIEWPEDSS